MINLNKFAKQVINDINQTERRIKEKQKKFETIKSNGAIGTSHRFKLKQE